MLLIGISYLWIGKKVFVILGNVKDQVLLAFTTASSEAAFPKLIEELEKSGCPKKIVSFVLPLGYSFNLDGSMLYMGFSSLFIAQAYGMHLSLATQVTMLLVLMLTSKGIAGVPRAALVVDCRHFVHVSYSATGFITPARNRSDSGYGQKCDECGGK